MRHSIPFIILLAFALAGCGGKSDAGSKTLLQSVAASIGGNHHSCASPAASGSEAQVACHMAAKDACPEGTAPNQVDFSEESGEFLVKGYSCV